ncbi:MAG: hypothetical protein JRI23_02190, partial [Deltaproteobacteria bacterium]|nr:hypothetical protein [Deltaproteobacteria bacterium]MBW2530289.1 hypothetical protein [Deltaproteobacteria bacterium]
MRALWRMGAVGLGLSFAGWIGCSDEETTPTGTTSDTTSSGATTSSSTSSGSGGEGAGSTSDLLGEDISHAGYFRLPNDGAYSFGARDMTYVPDCMGETDPSPDDGYPGCLLQVTLGANVVLSDIPVPTPDGSNVAVTVLPEWDLTGTLPESNGYNGDGTNSEELAAIYYEQGPPCRIWWTYMREYANRPADDDPLLAYSECSTTAPSPQGMWQLDQTGTAPYRVTSWSYNITRVPQPIADDHF